jgi:hypothetical protein
MHGLEIYLFLWLRVSEISYLVLSIELPFHGGLKGLKMWVQTTIVLWPHGTESRATLHRQR